MAILGHKNSCKHVEPERERQAWGRRGGHGKRGVQNRLVRSSLRSARRNNNGGGGDGGEGNATKKKRNAILEKRKARRRKKAGSRSPIATGGGKKGRMNDGKKRTGGFAKVV